MGKPYPTSTEFNIYSTSDSRYNPLNINKAELAGQPVAGMRQEWDIGGKGNPYQLVAQEDNPTGVIKDVYDVRTGLKVGALNTQTGTKYYQTGVNTGASPIDNATSIVSPSGKQVDATANTEAMPDYKPRTAQILRANQKIVEEAPAQQSTNKNWNIPTTNTPFDYVTAIPRWMIDQPQNMVRALQGK